MGVFVAIKHKCTLRLFLFSCVALVVCCVILIDFSGRTASGQPGTIHGHPIPERPYRDSEYRDDMRELKESYQRIEEKIDSIKNYLESGTSAD